MGNRLVAIRATPCALTEQESIAAVSEMAVKSKGESICQERCIDYIAGMAEFCTIELL